MAQWAGHTDLATDDYEVGFSADVVERSLSYWKRFTDAGLLAPLSEAQMYSGNAQDMPMWLDGKVFSITIPSSVISKFRETENLEIGVAPLPVTEGATETGINNGPPQVFTVSKNSEYPNAAIEFIDWMINSEEAALQLTTVRGLPASSVSRQVLVGEGLVDPLTASAMDVAGPYLGSKRNAISQDAEIQDTVMEMVLEGVLRGTLAPADGAAEWVSSLEALLDEKQAAVAAE
jgi:ABC-type glycerol-3-phosphate transport system substrate-binding protein